MKALIVSATVLFTVCSCAQSRSSHAIVSAVDEQALGPNQKEVLDLARKECADPDLFILGISRESEGSIEVTESNRQKTGGVIVGYRKERGAWTKETITPWDRN
jgi:hypothetical protein